MSNERTFSTFPKKGMQKYILFLFQQTFQPYITKLYETHCFLPNESQHL